MTATLLYRMQQAVWALRALSQPIDSDLVEAHLPPNLRVLFDAMPLIEQHHGLRVLRALLAENAQPPHDLAVAALLHDVGKSRYPLNVWQKSLAVAVKRIMPARFDALSMLDPQIHHHAHPFAVYAHHPAWSAAMLRAAGASERAIWLVMHHQEATAAWRDHPHYALLVQLQRADDAS